MANTTTRNSSARMQVFGTRTVITTTVAAAPGHNETRTYVAGEHHTIGSLLMPQGLSTALVVMGVATEDGVSVSGGEATTNATNAAKLLNESSPQATW